MYLKKILFRKAKKHSLLSTEDYRSWKFLQIGHLKLKIGRSFAGTKSDLLATKKQTKTTQNKTKNNKTKQKVIFIKIGDIRFYCLSYDMFFNAC